MRLLTSVSMLAGFGGLLAWHAAIVQGADPLLGWAGASIGGFLGILYSMRKANLELIGAVLGSLRLLQFETCYPCDGSNFMMPFMGAFLGAALGWLADRVAALVATQFGLFIGR